MEEINDLMDLLLYQVKNLYSVEEQISEAWPSIIERASHSSLKNALTHHAGLSTEQKKRLTQMPKLLQTKRAAVSLAGVATEFSNFSNKGIMGLIGELDQVLQNKLSNEVKDAAIIASVQKIEHYEICAYGTALAYAKQLNLHHIAQLLNETLKEEYDADDLLTALAMAALNKEAIPPGFDVPDEALENNNTVSADDDESTHKVSISERTINSPGGRAGTSHRRYGSGESRGH